jgi:FkbM family methyltransferase
MGPRVGAVAERARAPAPPAPARRRWRRRIACALVGRLVARKAGLRAVNRLHHALDLAGKRRFYYAFYEQAYRVEGLWTVDVAGHRLVLPLHRDFAFAWGNALAFHGLDPEVHELYERLLGGHPRPRAMFDVGANYGLHSLKFLAHDVRTLTFEPNPACHAYLRESAGLNGLRAEIAAVALGERTGTAQLAVPDGLTYLGSTGQRARARWPAHAAVDTLDVPQRSLDDAADEYGVAPDVVKLDTEGSELAILRGARRVLARARPLVVFESWVGDTERADLFALFTAAGYTLHALTFPSRTPRRLGATAFLADRATNFLARPRVH